MYICRTSDCRVFNGYVIFSSLDNVYVKLFVHETGLQVVIHLFVHLVHLFIWFICSFGSFGSFVHLVHLFVFSFVHLVM